jgi:hypothetical protein
MGLLPMEAIAECRSCGRRWPVFKGANAALIEAAREESVETIETERSVEPHHTDPLELDNLAGTSPHNHTVTITQEWTQSVELDTEQAKVENTTSGAELPGVGTFGRKAESAVKSTYSVSEGTKKVLTREASFEVPPGTKRVVSFTYARGVATRPGARGEPGRRGSRDPVQGRRRHDRQRGAARYEDVATSAVSRPWKTAPTMAGTPS